MKKVIVLLAFIIPTLSFAQSNKEDVDFIQSVYGKEKKEIIKEFVKVDESKKDAFWKLYDEYEMKRKELGKQRIALLEKYTNSFENLSEADIAKITKESISIGTQSDKLIASYTSKIEKAAGSKSSASFYMIETYLLSAVRLTIMENIPYIGELK
jgi:hypothetical protein